MFNLRLCNTAIIRYSQLKFGHMYLCGMDYKYFSPHCCKCNSFGCTAAIRWGNACHGPHSDSLYSGNEHSQFNSPMLVKREAGFPNPRRALIGSNQLWRVNDSPYYRELFSNSWYRIIAGVLAVKLLSVECYWTSLMISRHWLHQATSHYLSQCWPKSMSSYDITRPHWVEGLRNMAVYQMFETE